MKIYNVSARDYSQTSSLLKLQDDNSQFQVLKFIGMGAPILNGYDYTLIRKDYLSPFKRLPENQVEIAPAIIIRKSTGEQWNDYFQLKIANRISPDTLSKCMTSNDSIWHHPGLLFVSSKLMKELMRKGNDLKFLEGFSHFG